MDSPTGGQAAYDMKTDKAFVLVVKGLNFPPRRDKTYSSGLNIQTYLHLGRLFSSK